MQLEVLQKKENPLLKRVEVTFKAIHKAEPTPTRDALRAFLAKELAVERKHILVRNKLIEPEVKEKKEAAPKPEKPAPAAKPEKAAAAPKAEAPKPEAKPEAKPEPKAERPSAKEEKKPAAAKEERKPAEKK